MNKVGHEFPISEVSLTEVRRLREENDHLRSLLIANGIQISTAPPSKAERPQVSGTEDKSPGVRTAEERIGLFRNLFRGREDAYAIRWESNDGRSGYMPKADRDWKSYLCATAGDREKVNRQTRTYGHLLGSGREGQCPVL